VETRQNVKAVLLLAFLLPWTSAAHAADQVLGLLSLPDVFGSGPCDEFTPRDVFLYSAPESDDVVGSIRGERDGSSPVDGSCRALTVNVHRRQDGRVTELPTREYAYEAPAAIVLQQRERWFKVRLTDGAGWIHASERDRFLSLEELFRHNETTALTELWDRYLAGSPGANLVRVPGDPRRRFIGYLTPVVVIAFDLIGEQQWIQVELLSHSICESSEEPTVTGRGWMLAHAPSGEPTIWFSSRGC
jgi:hypothetical protein